MRRREGANKSSLAPFSLLLAMLCRKWSAGGRISLLQFITALGQEERATETDAALSDDLFAPRHRENEWWPVWLRRMPPSQWLVCRHVSWTAFEWCITVWLLRLSYSPSRKKPLSHYSGGFCCLSKQISPGNLSNHSGAIHISIMYTSFYSISFNLNHWFYPVYPIKSILTFNTSLMLCMLHTGPFNSKRRCAKLLWYCADLISLDILSSRDRGS